MQFTLFPPLVVKTDLVLCSWPHGHNYTALCRALTPFLHQMCKPDLVTFCAAGATSTHSCTALLSAPIQFTCVNCSNWLCLYYFSVTKLCNVVHITMHKLLNTALMQRSHSLTRRVWGCALKKCAVCKMSAGV